jgi:uncharacterized protein
MFKERKMEKNFFNKLVKQVKSKMETYGSHDFFHTQRVYNLAVHIAKKEKANLNIVKVAALLHDIARCQEENGQIECHAEKGAEISKQILSKQNFSKDEIKNICHAIRVHRYSKKLEAKTKEAQILQDADRLDALGAIVIARVFSFGGEKHRPIYNPAIKPKRVYSSDALTSINQFYEKTLKIKPETFKTKEARKIAKERYLFIKEFVNRFLKEWRGDI